MVCNICGVNDATIHLTEIVNSQMVEIHLCEACGQEKGTSFKAHFNLGDIFADVGEFLEPSTSTKKKKSVLECPACKLTYDLFGKSGRLGCPHCYEAFEPMLGPLIKRVQRATHHIGKKPTKLSKKARAGHDLRLLQDQLRQCVQNEAFEEAADIRDQIKKIEKKEKTKPSRKKK